jgi:hypothetical protein
MQIIIITQTLNIDYIIRIEVCSTQCGFLAEKKKVVNGFSFMQMDFGEKKT